MIEDRFEFIFRENTQPAVTDSLQNQYVKVGQTWQYVLPENLFTDQDEGDSLTISASLDNGEPLPNWIKFNGRTFEGIADNPQVLNILVKAKDLFGSEAQTGFTLTVAENTTNIGVLTKQIEVYPNPARNYITVKLPDKINNALLNIYNVTGQNVYKAVLNHNEQKIDLALPEGTYYVDISIGEMNFRKLLVIK